MKKQVSIVTGAAKGIGKSIAIKLKADGFFVVLVDVDKEAGLALEKEMGSDCGLFIEANINDEHSVQKLFEDAKKIKGSIDVLVNNAGIIKDKMIWKMSVEEFDAVIAVNLRGTWMMCREAARVMKEQNFGRIINIASRAWLGNAGQSNYSASKAGVVALTRVLALELGKYNVLVNAVAPGLIDTPLTQNLEATVLNKLIQAQPTKTIGKPEDVANLVSFLANEQTKFITGQVMYVDGGKNIGANMNL